MSTASSTSPHTTAAPPDTPDGLVTHVRSLLAHASDDALNRANAAFMRAAAAHDEGAMAAALHAQALVHAVRHDHRAVLAAAARAVALAADAHDHAAEAELLDMMGHAYRMLADYPSATEVLLRARSAARTAHSHARELSVLKNLGAVYAASGSHAPALDTYREALTLARTLEDERTEAVLLGNMGVSHLQRSELHEAIECMDASLVIRRRLNDYEGIGVELNRLGVAHQTIGNPAKALECFQQALDTARAAGNQYRESIALSNIGLLYRQSGDYAHALECYLHALRYARGADDRRGEAEILNNIGFLYLESGEPAAALQQLQQALTLWEGIGDQRTLAATLNNIGGACYQLRDYAAALAHLQRSRDISASLNNQPVLAATFRDIGDVLYAQGELVDAADSYEHALTHARAARHAGHEADALLGLSDVRREQGYLDHARQHADAAMAIALHSNAKNIVYKAHLALARVCERAGDATAALDHFRRFHHLKEEVFNEQSERLLAKLHALHDVETARREAEINRLRNEELARLNEQLESTLRDKTEILHIAAHDLRNPLTAVRLAADCIAEELLATQPDHQLLASVRHITDAVTHIMNIINNLLNVETIESGQMHLVFTAVSLGQIAAGVVEAHRPRAAAKEITLALELPPHACTVNADAQALRQVLDNLVSNAVKYSPRHTQVSVQVAASGDAVRCAVRDQGPGISADDQRKLFVKFARLSARPTGGEHSTRLGLAIVKMLVTRMHGHVWCDSEPGHGATFTVEFPARSHGGDH